MEIILKVNIDDDIVGMAQNNARFNKNELAKALEQYLVFCINKAKSKSNTKSAKNDKDWNLLKAFIDNNKIHLPDDYSFNREELYDR